MILGHILCLWATAGNPPLYELCIKLPLSKMAKS